MVLSLTFALTATRTFPVAKSSKYIFVLFIRSLRLQTLKLTLHRAHVRDHDHALVHEIALGTVKLIVPDAVGFDASGLGNVNAHDDCNFLPQCRAMYPAAS